jgi:argininosuccinate lyase
VRKAGLPFREAHHVTGRVVRLAEKKGVGLEELTLEDMQGVDSRITADVFDVLGVDNSVKSRTSFGGTAPENVRRAAKAARKKYL